MSERVELQLHTGMSDDISVISPKQAIIAAEEKGYKAIAITDKNSVQSFYDVTRCQKRYAPDLKVIYGAILEAEGEMRTVLVKEQPGPITPKWLLPPPGLRSITRRPSTR